MISNNLKNKHILLSIAIIVAVLTSFVSCKDDLLYDPSYIGEGEATIDASVSFYELTGNLSTRAEGGVSGGTVGNAIGRVNSLCVLLYKNGNLYKSFTQAGDQKELIGYDYYDPTDDEVDDENLNHETASDAIDEGYTPLQPTDKPENTVKPNENNNPHQAETKTGKATFKLNNIPYGKYHIYAVANMGDLTRNKNTFTDKDGNSVTIEDAIQTEDGLKNIKLTWNNDIANNNQMFGYFTVDNTVITANSSQGFSAPEITVNTSNIKLNAWLKRVVSKVTVAFDGSKLKDNIFIFIKSVEIKDIPETCFLGAHNPASPNETPGHTGIEITYAKQQPAITYNTGLEGTPEVQVWTQYVTNGNPVLGAAPDLIDPKETLQNQIASQHGENVKALYLYENLQGKGDPGTESDKRQQVLGDQQAINDKRPSYPEGVNEKNEVGEDIKAWKDAKKYGSYIEVKAFYRSNNTECLGQGEITYRFMLGQDVVTDYNVKRNYHYKLTLCFNGYANDVDWHIDYRQEPEIYVPDPYYISYLYDKSMEIPVQIMGNIEEGTTLKAEIKSNEWMPYDYFGNDDNNDNRDILKEYFNMNNPELKDNEKPNSTQWDETQKVFYGFLSLTDPGSRTQVEGTLDNAVTSNQNYWNLRSQGSVTYELTTGNHEYVVGKNKTNYSVIEKDGNRILMMPMFTRPKNLVKATGYTGNNPYVSYQRKATVEFTLMKGTEAISEPKTIEIIQVRRLVNPKGIWRAWNENTDFNVHLLHLESEYTTNPWTADDREFKSFTSIGPWSADVMVQGGDNGNDWIRLTPLGEAYLDRDGKTIKGKTGSTIDFKFSPTSTLSNDKQVRYGIIRVRYHNYTCEHLIFVRQGYAPISIIEGGAKWYSFNMRSQNEMAVSPCEEGSMFKRFRWDMPIKPENNIAFPFQTKPGDLKLYGKEQSANWDTWYANTVLTEWPKPTVENENMKVASVNDYLALYNNGNVQQGYGILYDGKADGVQVPLKDAYSYYSEYPTGANGKGCGMRGCFIYNENTGANIFLPLGASGYGRRRCQNFFGWPGTFYPGMLIYANRNTFMTAAQACQRPLLFDVYRRPGATYWTIKTEYEKVEDSPSAIPGDGETYDVAGWDFNYITFDFYPMAFSNIMIPDDKEKSDALPIRCVVDETTTPTRSPKKKKSIK